MNNETIGIHGFEENDQLMVDCRKNNKSIDKPMTCEYAESTLFGVLQATITVHIKYLLDTTKITIGDLVFDPKKITGKDISLIAKSMIIEYVKSKLDNESNCEPNIDEIIFVCLMTFDEDKLKEIFHRNDIPKRPAVTDFKSHNEYHNACINWINSLTGLPKYDPTSTNGNIVFDEYNEKNKFMKDLIKHLSKNNDEKQ